MQADCILLPPQPAPGELRVGLLSHLPAVLRSIGADPDHVFRLAGFDPGQLENPDGILKYRTVVALLHDCVRLSACSDLGLRLGLKADEAALGTVGKLVRNSPDVGTALHNLIEYLSLHNRSAISRLSYNGSNVSLSYVVMEGDLPGSDQVCAGAITHGFIILRTLCGPAWRPLEVRLPFRKPVDAENYRQVFQAGIRFNAKQAELVFPAYWMDLQLREADKSAYAAAARQVGQLETHGPHEVIPAVRRLIRTLILSGGCLEDRVAHALEVNKRTLNRMLLREGTTFRHLLDEVRFSTAQQMLRDTDRSIKDIALDLGYSESTPFGRAFKRWADCSPRAWRNVLRQDSR